MNNKSENERELVNKNFENLKVTVRRSFARLYATLKAKELKTLRQMEAIKNKYERQNINGIISPSLQNIEISYGNESEILIEISKYANINFEKLNVDSEDLFTPEDYDCPEDDHMYSYKCIEDVIQSVDPDTESLKDFIEQEAMRKVTEAADCVCHVTMHPTEVSMTFKEVSIICDKQQVNKSQDLNNKSEYIIVDSQSKDNTSKTSDINENIQNDNMQTNDPTQDWMNFIKRQIETEPTQITDVMEHSTIDCNQAHSVAI